MEPDTPYYGGTDLTVPATHVRPVHGRPGTTETPLRLRLGEALVASGVLTSEQLTRCLAEQAEDETKPRRRLGEIVTARGLASEVDIALGLASLTGFGYVDYSGLVLDMRAIRTLPREVCERHRVLPLGVGTSWVRLAMADPSDRVAVDLVRDLMGVVTVSLAIATQTAILDALVKAWSASEEELLRQEADQAPAAREVPASAPAVPAVAAEPPPEVVAVGEMWEYLFVGDGMPMEHPGYVLDAPTLDRRLDELGALGWEAVGLHSNGNRARVLLKRRRPA